MMFSSEYFTYWCQWYWNIN